MRPDSDNVPDRLPEEGETLRMRAVGVTANLPAVGATSSKDTQPMQAVRVGPDPAESTRQVISPASGAFAFFKSLEDAWAGGDPDESATQLMPRVETEADTSLHEEGFIDDIDPTEFDDVPDTMLTVGPVEPGEDDEAPISQVTVAPEPPRPTRPSVETAPAPVVTAPVPRKTQRRRGRRATTHDSRRRAEELREKLGIRTTQETSPRTTQRARGPFGEILGEPAEPAFVPPELHAKGPTPKWSALHASPEADLHDWVDTQDFGEKIEASAAPPPPVAELPGQRGALERSAEFQQALEIFNTLPRTAQAARARGQRFTDLASVTYDGQPHFDGNQYTLNPATLTGVSRSLWDHCTGQGYTCNLVPHFGRMRKGFQVEFWIRILW